ncbi:MAG: inorganic diphosphatase, partial [Lachnoanaerobaculum sp.]|nr:inorganic diphosphatase [Lachnoanaerobaculum sp.]
IGQISSLNEEELSEIESRLMPFLIKLHENSEEDMMFFMLTNILEQSTRLICVGQGAMSLVMKAFRLEEGSYDVSDAGVIELTSVVSRKKQLVPSLVVGIQM